MAQQAEETREDHWRDFYTCETGTGQQGARRWYECSYDNPPVWRNDVSCVFPKLRYKRPVGVEICSPAKFSVEQGNTLYRIVSVL